MPGTTTRPIRDLELLDGICRALASSPSLEKLAPALIRWVRKAVDDEAAEVRILLPGPGRRLRTVIEHGQAERERVRPSKLRDAFERRMGITAPSRSREGHQILVIPMVSQGESFGLIEVAAPAGSLDRSRLVLDAVAAQGATALRSIREHSRLRRRAEGLAEFAAFSRSLVAARSRRAAIQAATRFCSSQLRAPVVGWLAREGSGRLELITARGIGSRKLREVKQRGWDLPPTSGGTDIQALVSLVREALGTGRVEVARTSEAVLMAGTSTASLGDHARWLLGQVTPLLGEVLRHLAAVERAELRNQQLDLGIAWTAHELRGPLLALRAFVESQALHGTVGGRHESAEARRELDELVQQLEGLLQWAAGIRTLRRRPTDLMRLVRDAVAASMGTGSESRVSVSGPDSAEVVAEAGELRRAIANVVRNALTYSPPQQPVDVSVEQRDGSFVVSVRDRGPGVPAEETESLFDPFVRGRAGRRHRGGRGLGLFIARRVLEAHGGSIWVEPGLSGATFCLRVPR